AEAEALAERGRSVLLASATTSTHDIPGFLVADGVITERGGTTSHAAVVARQLGLPCVVGCGDGVAARLRGRVATVDGDTGRVYLGDALGGPAPEPGGAARPAGAEPAGAGPDGAGLEDAGPFEQLARWRREFAAEAHHP
ncbi:PEP-utilizing enzyme, partial [Streptomyces sp. 4N509B]|uniref:PEP-utilizing enzyme n=1 Tax=Streptomyces sp. 4N509B TaxID=3457413 RepID=UPI003FD2CE40